MLQDGEFWIEIRQVSAVCQGLVCLWSPSEYYWLINHHESMYINVYMYKILTYSGCGSTYRSGQWLLGWSGRKPLKPPGCGLRFGDWQLSMAKYCRRHKFSAETSPRTRGSVYTQNYFTSSDPTVTSYYYIFVPNSDILCAQIWRGRGGEDNSDEI